MKVTTLVRCGAVLAGALILLSCASCAETRPEPEPPDTDLAGQPVQEPDRKAAEHEQEGGWILSYAEGFDRETQDLAWVVTAGQVAVGGGKLVLSTSEEHGEVFLREPCFPAKSVRLEFDAYFPEGAEARDLSPFISGAPEETAAAAAYLFQFGAENNTVTRLRRIGEVVGAQIRSEIALEPDRVYHVVIENDVGQIRAEVDGTRVLTWIDPRPLYGPDHCHVGLYTWETEVHLDNIKVFQKKDGA